MDELIESSTEGLTGDELLPLIEFQSNGDMKINARDNIIARNKLRLQLEYKNKMIEVLNSNDPDSAKKYSSLVDEVRNELPDKLKNIEVQPIPDEEMPRTKEQLHAITIEIVKLTDELKEKNDLYMSKLESDNKSRLEQLESEKQQKVRQEFLNDVKSTVSADLVAKDEFMAVNAMFTSLNELNAAAEKLKVVSQPAKEYKKGDDEILDKVVKAEKDFPVTESAHPRIVFVT